MKASLAAIFMAGTSMLAAGTAFAQEAQAPQEGLQDIVVTAQRKEENLQRIPVAVTAVTAAQIDNLRVTNVKNLAGIAPNLQVNTQGVQSNPTITIRGISSGVSNNGVDPKVGIYVDGVYIGRSVGSIFDLADMQRVEVLRGPQGTLFGRNATSGALSITTAAPTGKFGVKGTISYGNLDAKRAKISINLPQFGPFSLKVAYLHDEIKGDYKNLIAGDTIDLSQRDSSFGTLTYANRLGGRNIDGVQVALRGEFGNLTADYKFDYTDSRQVGRAVQNFGPETNSSGGIVGGVSLFQPAFGGITNTSPTRLNAVANATSQEHIVTQGHSLTLTLPANDNLTLKSITAYRKFKQDPSIFDLAGTGGLLFTTAQLRGFFGDPAALPATVLDPANAPGPNDRFFALLTARKTSQKQFSQEFQIQLTTDPFELTAGVFFFHENSPATDVLAINTSMENGIYSGADRPIFNFAPLGAPLGFDINGDGVVNGRDVNSFDTLFGNGVTRTRSINDSMAGYAQGTFHVTDTLDITGGLRYTIDDRHTNIYSISGGQGLGVGPGKYKVEFKKLNYTGIITWRPTTKMTAYAKISSGYVAGGLLSGIPYKPETLTAYELGLKAQGFDNKVRGNLALFYSDYKDLQIQDFRNGVQTYNNAGKASITGAEAEVEVAPVAGLILSGNVGYAKFNFKKYLISSPIVGADPIDISDGAYPPYVSKWTGRVAAQYDAPEFSNGSRISATISGSYKSAYRLVTQPYVPTAVNPTINDSNMRPGYWLVDGRIGLVDLPIGGTKASLSAFGANLTNTHYVSFGAPVLFLSGSFERGRTYGVELGFDF